MATPVTPGGRVPVSSDAEREQARIEERLEAHGSRFRQKHAKDAAWPSFDGQLTQVSRQPRLKRFVEPDELFKGDVAQLPPDFKRQAMKKVEKAKKVVHREAVAAPVVPAVSSPPLNQTASQPTAVPLQTEAVTGLPMRPGWTLGQKVAMVGGACFLMYASFTKLRPLWGARQGGVVTNAILGPRASGEFAVLSGPGRSASKVVAMAEPSVIKSPELLAAEARLAELKSKLKNKK